MCQGQQQMPKLGYSPLPINLVQAGFDQIRRIPGVQAKNINIKGCNNPTFSSDGHNKLAETAPYPAACDKKGAPACNTGSGGAKSGGGSGGSGTTGGTSGGGTSGGSANGGTSGGSSAGGGGTGGTGGSGGTAGGSAQPVVDPDTGQTLAPGTGNGSGSGTGGGTAVDGTIALAQPIAVAGHSGWTTTQTLMLLAVALVLGLLLLPSLVSRAMAGRGGNGGAGGAGRKGDSENRTDGGAR
jgi:hypothetical protein